MMNKKFENGDKVPMIGLGTWKSDPGDVYEAVKIAVKAGYRHIDCAPIYGNEKEVGDALTELFEEGVVKREELWITSKLWNDAHRENQVIPALNKTLDDLQLDYLDLFLIHWPVALKEGLHFPEGPEDFYSLDEVPLTETWKGMEGAQVEGLARHIGVSNFSKEKIEELYHEGTVRPEMNQIELHPFLQQSDLVEFCQENGTHVTAYSPLGSKDRPSQLKKDNEPSLLEHPVIAEIAEKHNATPGQILIRWAMERDTIVIPKSVSENHITENIKAADLELDEDDLESIHDLDKGFRYVDGSFWAMEGSPYTLSDLWNE